MLEGKLLINIDYDTALSDLDYAVGYNIVLPSAASALSPALFFRSCTKFSAGMLSVPVFLCPSVS